MSEKGLYVRAHEAFMEKIYPTMDGVDYTRQDMFSLVGLQNTPGHSDYKKAFNDVLYNLTHVNKEPLLAQDGKFFRKVIKGTKEIEWWVDSGKKLIDFKWPRGQDGSSFGFEHSILIYPGDGIHIAGEGNKGKTALALSLAVENIDNPAFEGVTIFTTEFNDLKFKSRIERFDWVNLWDSDKNRPKFELLPSVRHYEDEILRRPNNLVIIDWIKMDDEAWKIRAMVEKMLKPLDKGVLAFCTQKRSYKNWGEGGEGGMDLVSAGFHLMYQKLWVDKVKAPRDELSDPNHKWFGFEIYNGGSKFRDIREVQKCPTCSGAKKVRGAVCGSCNGAGWLDK